MRIFIASILILVQLLITLQLIAPYFGYKLNHEVIMEDHCRSNYDMEFMDCDGYCVLIKHADKAQKHHEDQSSATRLMISMLLPPESENEEQFEKSSEHQVIPNRKFKNFSKAPSSPPPKKMSFI